MSEKVVTQRPNNEPIPGGITGKGFVKGDPRINRRGRPRSFDTLRKLAVKIAGEQADDEEEVTRVVLMLREMARSENPSDRALFLSYAYGKPKDEVEHTGEMVQKVIIEYAETKNDGDEGSKNATNS
jgi:hypothetical protein